MATYDYTQWDVSPQEAVVIQKELQSKIIVRHHDGAVTRIAGADISLNMYSDSAYAGIIVLSYPDLQTLGYACITTKITFPYIPGLLSFREIPALMKTWQKLIQDKPEIKPDILIVDGQGIAHPRGIGIASHLGLLLDMPTIGCAKSPLYGIYEEPNEQAGSVSYIHDKRDQQKIIGAALRTKNRTKPIIVSPGYKTSLEQSLEIMKNCSRGYRIPEPTRLAHNLVNMFRKGEIS